MHCGSRKMVAALLLLCLALIATAGVASSEEPGNANEPKSRSKEGEEKEVPSPALQAPPASGSLPPHDRLEGTGQSGEADRSDHLAEKEGSRQAPEPVPRNRFEPVSVKSNSADGTTGEPVMQSERKSAGTPESEASSEPDEGTTGREAPSGRPKGDDAEEEAADGQSGATNREEETGGVPPPPPPRELTEKEKQANALHEAATGLLNSTHPDQKRYSTPPNGLADGRDGCNGCWR